MGHRRKICYRYITNEAVRLINNHNTSRPMFLYLAHLAPHKGNEDQLLRAPDEEIAKFSYILDLERRIQAGKYFFV